MKYNHKLVLAMLFLTIFLHPIVMFVSTPVLLLMMVGNKNV